MKRLLLRSTLALTLAIPFAQLSLAQEPAAPPPPPSDTQGPPPGGHGEHRHPPDPHREALMLSKRLNLTTDQTSKLEPILIDRQSRMEALRSNTSLEGSARREQMHAIMEDTQTKLATVLTPDQLKQLKEMRGGMGRRGRGGPNGPDGHGDAPPPPPPTE